LAALSGELPAMETEQHLLSILPDPQSLSLKEVLEFRRLLSREPPLHNWQKSLAAIFDQIKREPLQEVMWQEIKHHLQEQADGFRQLWPASGQPSSSLRLECLCYPNMQPEVALAVASGLKLPAEKMYAPAGTNGITLLIYPSQLQPDDRQ